MVSIFLKTVSILGLLFSSPVFAVDQDGALPIVKIRILFKSADSDTKVSVGYCSGLILNKTTVLTADHCFRGDTIDTVEVESQDGTKINGDVSSISEFSTTADLETFNTQINDGYHLTFTYGDFATFQIPPVSFDLSVRVVTTLATALADVQTGNCTFFGYGSDDLNLNHINSSGERHDIRSLRHFPFHPSFADLIQKYITLNDGILAVIPTFLEDGDSGGPILCTTAEGHFDLIGILRSTVPPLNFLRYGKVDTVTMNIFELLSTEADWINQHVGPRK